MEVLLNYTLKSGIGLLAVYLFYYLLLRNETNFPFNRLYLLLAPVVALTLPLIKWPALLSPGAAVTQTLQAIQLSEVTVVSYKQPSEGFAMMQWLTLANLIWSLYLLVVLFLTYKLYRQLWHIRSLKSGAASVEQTPDAVQIIQLKQHYASFAFLNYVFLSNQEKLSSRERQQVLAHELAHVQLRHTYDILFYELLSILVWFNPVIWLLKKELRNVHEFQADARVLEQHQPQEYRTLLSKEVLFNMGLPVGSHFQKPQVLQRLHMLQQHGKQRGWLKPLLTLPLFVVLLFSLTSHQVTADIATTLTPASKEKQPEQRSSAAEAQLNEAASETEESRGDVPEQLPLRATPPATINAEENTPEPEQRSKEQDDTTADIPVQESKPDDNIHNLLEVKPVKPYTYVEQMPRFKEGEQEMLKFLGMNIRYPIEAQEAGLEGLVVLSFTVDYDGSLNDIQVIKKLGMGTDEEAVRVVEQMNGNWEPGRQNGKAVPVRYTLPIRFAIK